MAEVKWIKITTDIFDDEKILLIESMPDSYAIITVWFKLLCLAGKQNNSGVFMMGQIAYTDKMLATIFRMKESTVQFALQTFEQFGMIEIVDGVITIPNWGKHQNLDQLESKKAYMQNYMQKYREKQKALTSGDSGCKTNCKTNSKTNVRQADKEREKEGDLRDNILSGKPDDLPEKCALIIARLNEKTGANFRSTTESTRRHIHARLEEGFTVEDFYAVIDSKAAEWRDDPRMAPYLRPDTLFCTKFEGYLQAAKRNATGGGVWAREEQDDLDFVK